LNLSFFFLSKWWFKGLASAMNCASQCLYLLELEKMKFYPQLSSLTSFCNFMVGEVFYLLAIYSQKAIKNVKVLKSKAFKDFQ
jgi:hypothetical protein